MTGTLAALAGLAGATLLSEDAAGVAAGLAAATGTVPVWGAVTAIGVGIWIGDLGLWAAGRISGQFVTRLTTWRGIAPADLDEARARLRRHAPAAIIGSRFLPGTRLAVYLGAGVSGVGFVPFAAWAAVGVALWAPLLVLTSMALGNAIAAPGAYSAAAAAGLILAALLFWRRRKMVSALALQLARLSRWEFWPPWLFYAPIVPWVGWLMLTRGARALAAANPGLEDGGFVGESKARILSILPKAWTLPHVLVPAGSSPAERVAVLRAAIASNGWTYPIILKPDVGQRGASVRLVRSEEAALAYFIEQPAATVAQIYHPGPYEAGIFYYRLPGEATGHIFSITDKHFPFVVGDGTATLETLITGHHRYRLQARIFLARHRSQLARVPRAGERVRLAIAGNHAQGTMMLDGADLITDALVARIDEIAQSIDGFFIGRFDVRYRDPGTFMAGTDLAIVELNGVTAEATHIYDPSWSLFRAYRTLFRQWWLVFAIGAANVRLGRSTTSLGRLARLSLAHLRSRVPQLIAD